MPYHLIANLTLPDDDIESATRIAEIHVTHQMRALSQSVYASDSNQSFVSHYSDSAPQTIADTNLDDNSQSGVLLTLPSTKIEEATPADNLSKTIKQSTPAQIGATQSVDLTTETPSDAQAAPTTIKSSKYELVTYKTKAETPSTPSDNNPNATASKTFIYTHELPSISRDITLALTIAHSLRTKNLRDTTLRQFYDCTIDTINKSNPEALARLKDYPDVLKSLSRNFIKNLDANTFHQWFTTSDPPFTGASDYELVNHPLFNGSPTDTEMNFRLDNCLIRYALTSTFTGKVERQFIPTFHSSIRQQLTDRKSAQLFDWMSKVRKESSVAYDKDVNFYTPKSTTKTLKQAPNLALSTKHSCPPITKETTTFIADILFPFIAKKHSILEKFTLPVIEGYTPDELISDLFVEMIAHFPTWIRPNFVVTTSIVESLTQFLSLNLTTADKTNLLWTLNSLLPEVKSMKLA